MGTLNWNELFPGKWSAVIFISYMTLFVNQGIIVTWSQNDKKYEYNTITVVLMTEVLKLIVSVILYCRENTILQLFKEIKKYKNVLVLYMVPAVLYCLYNNLAFINLAAFDPTTYYLLLQLRVVMTGIVFQVIFKKYLSTIQWISLLLLTLGCMIKHLNFNIKESFSLANFYLGINTFYIFIQTMCSCLAGVYNEYLLKRQGANINIFVQNVFMYIDSILCNIVVLAAHGSLLQTFENASPSIFVQPKVILIIINNSAIGIITSFFLKNLNSILKNFASALELIFTAILSWILFGIPIYINTVFAIAIVSYSVLLYSQNPVQNTHPKVDEIKTDMKESVPLPQKMQTV